MAEIRKKSRPEFRNIGIGQILSYRLPLPGIVSILHRISGALLFLSLPFSLYLFQQSLTSAQSFEALKSFASGALVKLSLLLVIWAFVFHCFAGLRHLLMDLHYGVAKASSKKTAAVVCALSSIVTFAIALKLFGIF
ncbi:MAG: succinate dehydrogenase subunit C [Glomeribacter sp. 1016415]|uniref:succinate dehydrogenase, cytochrome b556 subunit n=1 Tax=Mycoavidus cysteinexigens TaxID=1553431 RepID=UPI00034AD44A|nr:succinate dehydrogenase, cytochrome b556 subunit [Mycoavidus cysteinexigens]MCX8566550.1 succinate dehydrogenase subunit C [Glomeribacter sp. 1016415]GAM53629.1 succinate dehydrogenase cytochrome b-556 subunit [bacterium endosymbiont of Mortierella elongata FMR23-6]